MNIDDAVAKACEEPTLVKALSWIAVWETERVVKQAIQWKETGVSTASHGGGWDTCFETCFDRVVEVWNKKHERVKASTSETVAFIEWMAEQPCVGNGSKHLCRVNAPHNPEWCCPACRAHLLKYGE